MPDFKLVSKFKPMGDQPAAIAGLLKGFKDNQKHQTLLGATGTGKSVTYDTSVYIYEKDEYGQFYPCLLYTSPSPRDRTRSRMPSSA